MKLGKFISKLEDLQNEMELFIIDKQLNKYPLHSVFSPYDDYIEIYSDEWSLNKKPLTVKECLIQIYEYDKQEIIDKSIEVNLIVGNEDSSQNTIDCYLSNILIEDNQVFLS
jgi:hypothetical protein